MHNHLIGTNVLCDGLYKLKLDGLYVETILTLHHNVGTKHILLNERSTFLWHKRLGHISREMMERLMKNEILPDLDFMDLNICMDCIKGKQRKHTKKGATRSTQLLEIMHTDIYGPLMLILSKRKDTLSPLLMNIHVTFMSTYCNNLRQWMP